MAGDWLKFDKSTPDKPEVWDIAERLDIDPDAVVGKLLRVWSWFDEQSEDGNAPSVSKMLLDRKVGVTGFCNAMVSCGWMSEVENQVLLPNFDRHNGKTAKNRALTAKRVVKHKQKNNAEGNDLLTLGALPREEKRRVLQNTSKKTCPYDAVLSVFHETLPELPSVIKLTETRKKKLAARWFGSKHSQTIDWWRDYFMSVKRSPFLMGSTGSFRTTFDWLIEERNFIKVIEGNYV